MSERSIASNLSPDEATPIMPAASRYAGEPMDISSRRSIAIVLGGHGSEPIGSNDDHAVVDHFYHEGQFWRAVVPLDGVDQVLGQAFNFSKAKRSKSSRDILFNKEGLPKRTIPILNHLQSRFILKPDHPLGLYPLRAPVTGEPTHRVYDFIYSVETAGPVGVSFNLRDALSGNLISSHRFLSTREMVFQRIVVENQYVTESPPLPLKSSEKRALLAKSLLRSHSAGMSETYYLYRFRGTNNCTSSPFQILDTVVDYGFLQQIGSMLYRLPLSPRLYLRARGMDSDPAVRKLVRAEFTDYIDAPDTQERKREHVRLSTRAIRVARKEREAKLSDTA
jgi:hypothetical protein